MCTGLQAYLCMYVARSVHTLGRRLRPCKARSSELCELLLHGRAAGKLCTVSCAPCVYAVFGWCLAAHALLGSLLSWCLQVKDMLHVEIRIGE